MIVTTHTASLSDPLATPDKTVPSTYIASQTTGNTAKSISKGLACDVLLISVATGYPALAEALLSFDSARSYNLLVGWICVLTTSSSEAQLWRGESAAEVVLIGTNAEVGAPCHLIGSMSMASMASRTPAAPTETLIAALCMSFTNLRTTRVQAEC